jgi:hypothetical protein
LGAGRPPRKTERRQHQCETRSAYENEHPKPPPNLSKIYAPDCKNASAPPRRKLPPTEPLTCRFTEMVMVNGPAWKALIEEEFGDGIMSAIDFDMAIERVANPKGDRVKITMSGKFLPYKYYGASGNVPEYGFKEG